MWGFWVRTGGLRFATGSGRFDSPARRFCAHAGAAGRRGVRGQTGDGGDRGFLPERLRLPADVWVMPRAERGGHLRTEPGFNNPQAETAANPRTKPAVNSQTKPGFSNQQAALGVSSEIKLGFNPQAKPGVNSQSELGEVNSPTQPGVNPQTKPGVSLSNPRVISQFNRQTGSLREPLSPQQEVDAADLNPRQLDTGLSLPAKPAALSCVWDPELNPATMDSDLNPSLTPDLNLNPHNATQLGVGAPRLNAARPGFKPHSKLWLRHSQSRHPGRRPMSSFGGSFEEDKDGRDGDDGGDGQEAAWGSVLKAAVDSGPPPGPGSATHGNVDGPEAEAAAVELARCYKALGPEARRALLRALARDPYGVDHEAAARVAGRLAHMQAEGTRDAATLLQAEERLRSALTPRYKHLLARLSRLEGGVKLLVDMRADALAATAARGPADGPHLKELSAVLKGLLSEWFSIGLLRLERVTWQSPCDMLQRIAQYEAVHPVRHWTDMRRRVGPYRRCFVFTHAAMPREPLVVLHVALAADISAEIRSIVRESPASSSEEVAERVRAAVFYSISATQRGLQGIDLGHHLIKQVVRQLQAEFPSSLHDFSSLSPIPGFTRWLAGVLASHDPRPPTSAAAAAAAAPPLPPFLLADEAAKLESLTGLPAASALRAALARSHSCPDDSDEDAAGPPRPPSDGAALEWWRRAELREALRAPLLRLCARYLVTERRRGRALDPVAHFHLRNGAEAWRLNWMADASPRGLRASAGVMANYRYWPERTAGNAAAYELRGRAAASEEVAAMAAMAAGGVVGGSAHDDASKL